MNSNEILFEMWKKVNRYYETGAYDEPEIVYADLKYLLQLFRFMRTLTEKEMSGFIKNIGMLEMG